MTALSLFLLASAASAYVVTNQGTQMDPSGMNSQSKWNNGYRGYDNSMDYSAEQFGYNRNMNNPSYPYYSNTYPGTSSGNNYMPMNQMTSQPYQNQYGSNGMKSMYQSYPRRV